MKSDRNVVTLDDLNERALAKADPEMFLAMHPAPVLIDEVQYAPELFPYIKMKIDNGAPAGSYWLTGSQAFKLMKLAQESLLSDSSLKKLYTRQHFPNVLTIYRICDALQISVSEFFAFNIDSAKLVDEKVILLSSYDALSPNNKRLILELIQNLK